MINAPFVIQVYLVMIGGLLLFYGWETKNNFVAAIGVIFIMVDVLYYSEELINWLTTAYS
jgi:hypothetical protein